MISDKNTTIERKDEFDKKDKLDRKDKLIERNVDTPEMGRRREELLLTSASDTRHYA